MSLVEHLDAAKSEEQAHEDDRYENIKDAQHKVDALRLRVMMNSNPLPATIVGIVLGIMIMAVVLWQVYFGPSMSGVWVNSRGQRRIIRHNPLTGRVHMKYLDDVPADSAADMQSSSASSAAASSTSSASSTSTSSASPADLEKMTASSFETVDDKLTSPLRGNNARSGGATTWGRDRKVPRNISALVGLSGGDEGLLSGPARDNVPIYPADSDLMVERAGQGLIRERAQLVTADGVRLAPGTILGNPAPPQLDCQLTNGTVLSCIEGRGVWDKGAKIIFPDGQQLVRLSQ